MRRAFLSLISFLILGSATGFAADYPKIELSTKQLKLTLYPPDAEKGFYRGSRFCWGGVLGDVEIGGHKLFHAWKDRHDPKNHDDIIGPVVEFGQDMPLGYDDAKVGETFVKVGVGELVKPDEKKYLFHTNYKVQNTGIWKVQPGRKAEKYTDSAEMRQTLVTKTGYSYHLYIKVWVFDTDRDACMNVEYELINIGTKKIVTDVYNHNFFNVDRKPIGPDYSLHFGELVEGTKTSKFENAKFVGRKLEFPKPLDKGQIIGEVITTEEKTPAPYQYSMHYNKDKKEAVRVEVVDIWPEKTERKKFQVWSIGSVLCPEPFYKVEIEPGDSLKWSAAYGFIVAKK